MSVKQFIDLHLGKQIDYDWAYSYQCVDWVNYYVANYLKQPITSGLNYAKEYVTRFPAGTGSWAELIKNDINNIDLIPEVGDIIVFDAVRGNPYGHVAIVYETFGSQNKFISADQNSTGRNDGVKLITHTYTASGGFGAVTGWIRQNKTIVNNNSSMKDQFYKIYEQIVNEGFYNPLDVQNNNWMKARLDIDGEVAYTRHIVNDLLIPIRNEKNKLQSELAGVDELKEGTKKLQTENNILKGEIKSLLGEIEMSVLKNTNKPNFPEIPDKLKSRKLWVTILTAVFTVSSAYFPEFQGLLNYIIPVALGYIGVQGVDDIITNSNKEKDGANFNPVEFEGFKNEAGGQFVKSLPKNQGSNPKPVHL